MEINRRYCEISRMMSLEPSLWPYLDAEMEQAKKAQNVPYTEIINAIKYKSLIPVNYSK